MKLIKEITALANEYGCKVTDITISKHVKFYLETPSGKHLLVCSRTASDRRASANNVGLIRRWAKLEKEKSNGKKK